MNLGRNIIPKIVWIYANHVIHLDRRHELHYRRVYDVCQLRDRGDDLCTVTFRCGISVVRRHDVSKPWRSMGRINTGIYQRCLDPSPGVILHLWSSNKELEQVCANLERLNIFHGDAHLRCTRIADIVVRSAQKSNVHKYLRRSLSTEWATWRKWVISLH